MTTGWRLIGGSLGKIRDIEPDEPDEPGIRAEKRAEKGRKKTRPF